MNKILTSVANLISILALVLVFSSFSSHRTFGEESESILEQLEVLQKNIKTLEKAVYSQDINNNFSTQLSDDRNDVLTKHLLKLSELEEQFKILTNNFEEINFKLDKLSNRITKIQADNQMRIQDLERAGSSLATNSTGTKEKKLPGSSEPQDLGGVSDSDIASLEQIQKTQSIESVGTVIAETTQRIEKILPKDASPEEKYKFAVSFLKIGDYETAEYALKEFIDSNANHSLAGNAQYWYGETFRVRELYQDAATAYLDGYQKYPKSSKAPINLLKLGVMLVQIGEKEQGCSMILGVKEQYPEVNQSIIQKAEYEKKKFNCEKKS